MTSTTTRQGYEESRPSSKVMAPPGGKTSFSFGTYDDPPAERKPARETPKSNILGQEEPTKEAPKIVQAPSQNTHNSIFGGGEHQTSDSRSPAKKRQNTPNKNIPIPKGLMYGPVNGIVYCPVHGAQYQPDKDKPGHEHHHHQHHHQQQPNRQSPGVRSRSPPSPHFHGQGFTFSIEDLTSGHLQEEAPPELPPFIVDTRPPYNPKLRILRPRTPSKPRVFRDPITMEGAFEPEKTCSSRCSSRNSNKPAQERNLISGKGDLGNEHNPMQRSPRVSKIPNGRRDVTRNPVTGSGDLGAEMHPTKPFMSISPQQAVLKSKIPRVIRDPIIGAGELGNSYDPARHGPERPKTPNKKSVIVRRDSLRGEGGPNDEYDPIRLYGRRRRFPQFRATRDPIKGQGDFPAEKSDTKRFCYKEVRRNPIVGQGDFTSERKQVFKRRGTPVKNEENVDPRNPIVGVGTEEMEVVPSHKRQQSRDRLSRSNSIQHQDGRNPITGSGSLGGGSNPITDRNGIENTPPRQSRRRLLGSKRANSNPITGNGCDCWDIHKEPSNKARTPKTNSVCNPLTGHNCQTFALKPDFKIKSRGAVQSKAIGSNPITGSNCNSFDISAEDRQRTSRRQKASPNPLTGMNCQYYDVHTAQSPRGRSTTPSNVSYMVAGRFLIDAFDTEISLKVGQLLKGAVRNPISGAGKEDVSQKRANRKSKESYNPLTHTTSSLEKPSTKVVNPPGGKSNITFG